MEQTITLSIHSGESASRSPHMDVPASLTWRRAGASPTTPHILHQKGISAEIRAALAGHSLETTMKYGSPKRPEIERAVTALDDAATI
jgi:hypothetical protein